MYPDVSNHTGQLINTYKYLIYIYILYFILFPYVPFVRVNESVRRGRLEQGSGFLLACLRSAEIPSNA